MLDTLTARPARAAAARATVALADAEDGLRRRLDDDTGAQAAEYCMLGGVSAAACGGLIIVLQQESALSGIVDSVVGALSSLIGSWF